MASSPSPNPRRRYLCNAPLSRTIPPQSHPLNISTTLASPNHSLRKSATFHSPTSPPSASHDPILSIPSIPKRSPTCSRDLEDTIAAGGNRIAQLIGAVDRSLSGLQSFSSSSQETLAGEALPVPRFMIDIRIEQDCKNLRPKHHSSDSGIGSTESSEDSASNDYAGAEQGLKTVNTINGAGTMVLDSAAGGQHALSEYACRQIQKHLILPIMREEKLKKFHPLVSGIPHRVARKEITCLRDLEKILLWLAPKWSFSKASFLLFCETSIQCIHTTVDYLNDSDQRRPTDRPYTNGYFLDLVEQIRQYASVLAASRARNSHNPDTSDKISLIGGLSQTGRPAELVRMKNGRTVSLCTGEELHQEKYKQGIKRPVDDACGDELLRSMARRRKSSVVVKEEQKCKECSKVFKRPCDLTKHEKTHSRPWKCSDVGCKYHEYGWPTEKERDRHMNDKHSAAPSMFKCHYHPCPYESKRESNCKQHMEKAHGWVYVRSKNNGKAGRGSQSGKTPPTPQISTPGSNIFAVASPKLDELPLDDLHKESTFGLEQTFEETFGPFDSNFYWKDASADYTLGGLAGYSSNSHRPSWDSSTANTTEGTVEDESLFGDNFDWSNMDHDLMSLSVQLSTPATSVEQRPLDVFSRNASASLECSPQLHDQALSLSPGAQGDAMLYSPYSIPPNEDLMDEGYGEVPQELASRPTQDFSLFDPSGITDTVDGAMFDELPPIVGTGWHGRGQDLAQQLGMSGDLMQLDG